SKLRRVPPAALDVDGGSLRIASIPIVGFPAQGKRSSMNALRILLACCGLGLFAMAPVARAAEYSGATASHHDAGESPKYMKFKKFKGRATAPRAKDLDAGDTLAEPLAKDDADALST